MIILAVTLAAAQASDGNGPWRQSRACAFKPGMKNILLVPARTRSIVRDGKQTTESVVALNGKAVPYASAWRQSSDLPWSSATQPIMLNNRSYEKYGQPRVLSSTDVVPVGDKDGVVIAAAADDTVPQVIYVLYSGVDCRFQPYRLKE